MRQHAILIWFGLALVVVFLGGAANFYKVEFIQKLDVFLYDQRLGLTMPNTLDERIVIIDIDEKSLKEEGRWPWGRDRLAVLVDKLFDQYSVAVVGFDVVFAEKDDSSGLKVLQKLSQNQLKDSAQFQTVLEQIKPQLDYDSIFASKIKNRNVVLGYYFNNSKPGSGVAISGTLPDAVFPSGTFGKRPIAFVSWDGYGGNLAELQSNAASAGYFNPLVDFDGVVRRLPMIMEYNGAYFESLSLAMTRVLLGSPKLAPGYANGGSTDYAGLEWLSLTIGNNDLQIPVDQHVSALIPYRGKEGSFRYIPATDVINGRVPVTDLSNKIVLVGTSAPGLLDLRSTPVGEVYPGVEIHANMIAGILDQNLKHKPAYALGAEVVLLLTIGVVLSFILPLLSPIHATLLSGVSMVAVLLGNFSLWHVANLAFPVASAVLLILSLFILKMSFGYFVESRAKRQITGLFGQYVPAEVVDEMSKNPEHVSMEGESRDMTILFSDVRNFTTISEGLEAKELSELMNEFLTPLSRVVYKYRGTIDKYMGDCIMAFWGAPLLDPHHARNAILAGLEMQQRLAEMQPAFKARGWPEISIGVGINTGRVSVGNMGSEVRVAYTVMGDAVNLASRLEGITKQYGVGILVGEHTKNGVTDIIYRELDQVRVKGKDKPVFIYEPIGQLGQVAQEVMEEIKLFHQTLKAYRKQDWDQAELQLYNLQRMSPTRIVYQVYAERVAYFRNNPPGAGWDGVFVYHSK